MPSGIPPTEEASRVARHRTAIVRDRLSIGARAAWEDGLLSLGSVLDYGCGKGDDVRQLGRLHVPVSGWDPYFFPDPPPEHADVVLLTYVLNTIEDAQERAATLQEGWAKARQALVLTTRLSWERQRVRGTDYADGVLTSRGTFQHLFTSDELKHLAGTHLRRPGVVARPGVVYVFRRDEDRLGYLSRRYGLAATPALGDFQQAQKFYEARGRLPEQVDGLAAGDVHAFAPVLRRTADPERVAEASRKTTISLLMFLAMDRFHGPVVWGSLSPPVQADIRAAFGSFKHATWRAARLLGQLRDDDVVRRTMRASVGKLTPSALYVHRRALAGAPVLLRIYEECAALVAGRPEQWDVVKLHHDRRMISWLSYPEFDRDAHPVLQVSQHVDLSSLKSGRTDYADSSNPPLLHRKEEFLSGDDERRDLYARLTASEVRAGLYAHPERIGTRAGWESELARCGRTLRGHRLVRAVIESESGAPTTRGGRAPG